MKCIVTGFAGFLGRHLATKLMAKGAEVIGIDDFSGSNAVDVPKATNWYNLSVVNTHAIDRIFSIHKPTHCYHLAAYAAECLSPFVRTFNYTNNCVGTANIVNACINNKVEVLSYTSSVAVYGQKKPFETGFNEYLDSPTPSDPYGNAKLCSERDIQIAHEQHGLNYRIWRMHNVIGTHQNRLDPFRNVVGIFISKILDGNFSLPIFGDGKQVRQFTPVEYVVKGLTDSKVPLNDVYNIGSDQEYTILELADTLMNIVWADKQIIPTEYQFLPPRHEAFYPKCNHRKIQKYIGHCSYDLKEELTKILTWAKTDKGFASKLPKVEVLKGLPESWKKYV